MSLPASAAISTSAAGSQTTTVTSCQCPHTPAGVATGSTSQPSGASSSTSGETNKRQQQQQQQQLYRAVADYTARHDGELTVRVGDLIGSVRPLGNGWSVGRMHESMTSSTSRDGTAQVHRQAGIFPSLCVVPISTPSKCRPGPDLVDTVTSSSPAHHYNDTFSSSDDQHRHQCPACARDAVSTCDVDNSGSAHHHQAPSYRQLPPAPPPASGTSRRVVEFADCYEECFPVGGSGGIGIITGSTAGEGVSGQSSRAIVYDDHDEHGTSCHVRYRRPPPPPVAARDRHDDDLPSGMHSSATAALNTTCGTRSGSPTSLQVSSPRRQQQPKPHLIVKPTRDPSGTDSPGPSTLPSDRTYQSQQQQQQQQRHQQHLHCNQTGCSDCNRRRCQESRELDPESCCNEHHQYTRGLSSPGSRQPDVDADITEDADDVIRTSWCGWRSTGRSNNRTKSASKMATGSILRPSCRQTTMTSSTAQSGGLSGMSTFMGRSDPNLRHEEAEGTRSPSRRPQLNGHDNVDNFCHDDVPLDHQSVPRCCKIHHNSQSRDIRSMNLSPSAPDLSFGLSSPSGGDRLMHHFRSGSLGISSSASAGKTILKSRTPRVGDYSLPTLRSGFGSTSSGRRRRTGLFGAGLAACWCRLLVSMIVGLLSGLLTYAVMTYDLEYRLLPVTITSVAVVLVVGALLTASRFCRCVAALIPPTVSTACGRAALCLLAVHLLLAGPATNIAVNTEEAVRSLTCSAELALNRTAGLLRPFDAMMKELDRTVARLEGAAADVARGLKPLDEGLDAVEMDVNNARTQLLGTRRTCKNLVDRAFSACDTGIIKAQSQCIGVMGALGNVYQHAREVLDRINPERWAKQQQQQAGLVRKKRSSPVPDYSLPGPMPRSGGEDSLSGLPADSSNICEPLTSSQVCRGLNDSDTLCQPAKWAGEAIQEAINGTRLAMRALEKALRFRVTSSPYDMARSQANTSMTSAHEGFAVFESRVHTYLHVVSLIRCALPGLVALLLFYAAFRYARSYICAGDTFDNVYIGSSFAQLDRRRYDATGDRLLPLRKHERRHTVDYRTTRMSPSERRLVVSGLCVAVLCLCCSLACCTFDQVLYWVLESADESNKAASLQYDTGSGINTPLPPAVPESVEMLKHQSQSDNVIDEGHTRNFVEHQLRMQRHRRNSPVRTEKDAREPHSGRRRAVNGNGIATARVADARFWSNGDVSAGDESRQREVADDDETANGGDGVIVDLLDVFVRGFRPDQFEPQPRPSTAVIEQARTAACVPSAFRPSCGLQIALVVLHVIFLVAVLIKPYSFRARPAIAGYFYSERAAERAVHLYSVLVRQRRRMPSLLRRLALAGRRRLVQTIAAKAEGSGAAADGRCAAFLRRRGAVDIVRCVVCWDAESAPPTSIAPKSSSGGGSSGSANAAATWKFRHCPCGAIYCPECFVDVGRACPLCRHDNGDRLLSGVSGCGGGYLSNDEDDDEDDDDSCNYIDYLTFDEQIDDSPYCCYDDRSRVEL